MITILIATVCLSARNPTYFNAKDVAYQPMDRLQVMLGPKIRLVHVPGNYFNRDGFDKLFVNAAGTGMTEIILRPKTLSDWKHTAALFGINTSHAASKMLGDPPSPIPLVRNSMEISNASGLPLITAIHKPWRLVYRESAVANTERLKANREKINAVTGAERIKLIKPCYDWFSELDITTK